MSLPRALETALKNELGVTSIISVNLRSGSGGCISETLSCETDIGNIFIKTNKDKGAETMFNGECRSLETIKNTRAIKVPSPHKVLKLPDGNGSAFAMEFLNIKPLCKFQTKLGEHLASLHMHNRMQMKMKEQSQGFVGKAEKVEGVENFGFDTTTCCGLIPLANEWKNNWQEFFARQRLKYQIDILLEKHQDRQVVELWSRLQQKLGLFFKDIDIFPSLLHGDLWGGNAGELSDRPVIFDPAAFYGHDEFDLAIAMMFGGFDSQFFTSYHASIPKKKGFKERNCLYKLFHYLNHWNHFGSGYRGSTISTFHQLLKCYE